MPAINLTLSDPDLFPFRSPIRRIKRKRGYDAFAARLYLDDINQELRKEAKELER